MMKKVSKLVKLGNIAKKPNMGEKSLHSSMGIFATVVLRLNFESTIVKMFGKYPILLGS